VQRHRDGVAVSAAAARVRGPHGRAGRDPAPVAPVAELHARTPPRVVVHRVVRVIGARSAEVRHLGPRIAVNLDGDPRRVK
jgi:hypothetical protein